MQWAERWREQRNDPRLLLEGAQSVIVVAMNYYPRRLQDPQAPQFAYYAYGKDYHKVLKRRMKELARHIEDETGCATRLCVDSAPVRERYWAVQAGVGFVGRNNQLIIPGRGSYFFIGVMLTTLPLQPNEPCLEQCLGCGACERARPGGALRHGEAVDAARCLSCLTIEHEGELPQWVAGVMGRRVYGCDACQQCCPHNAHATPCTEPLLQPSEAFLSLTVEKILAMTPAEFDAVFAGTAVRRAGLARLQRNAALAQICH